jgi:hypothetical protein
MSEVQERVIEGSARTQPKASAAPAQASFPITKRWSVESLLGLTKQQTVDLWSTLPAVSLEELQGHFMGLVPNHGDAAVQASTQEFMYNHESQRGYWLGKAYRKTGENVGEGYNRWRFPDGRIVRGSRFTTEIGPWVFDGTPSLLMYYGAYRAEAPTFVDEVRKLDDFIYVGVGSTLNAEGKRHPGHFILTGPTDEWVGGAVGELVPGFVKPTK